MDTAGKSADTWIAADGSCYIRDVFHSLMYIYHCQTPMYFFIVVRLSKFELRGNYSYTKFSA